MFSIIEFCVKLVFLPIWLIGKFFWSMMLVAAACFFISGCAPAGGGECYYDLSVDATGEPIEVCD